MFGNKPVLWSINDRFGPTIPHGFTTNFGWTSDPIDTQMAEGFSLQLTLPTTVPEAMVIVPSTTSGLGVLVVANASGTGGNSITVTIATPVGTTTYVTVAGNVITVTPAINANNQNIVVAINNNAAANALVTAYAWGWVTPGSPQHSLVADPMDLARNDLALAGGPYSLVGGNATAAPAGTFTLQWSNDLINWQAINPPVSWTPSTTGTNVMSVGASYYRYARVQWAPGPGASYGLVHGTWVGKGWTH